ncbi:hypothetical protein CEXT_620651 [Caerostris extrusa]|uniref:Uncharacterized protein n=1 Tax=Caerostris extrusa TaxID=172846 RepID=A0AAV4PBZ4_CAEEX|nr:hypothetical protein CEXT_620651 [Caerostris extrusa]
MVNIKGDMEGLLTRRTYNSYSYPNSIGLPSAVGLLGTYGEWIEMKALGLSQGVELLFSEHPQLIVKNPFALSLQSVLLKTVH